MNQWILTEERLPKPCEQVLIFNAPRRELAQYIGHIKQLTPWSMMNGTYLDADQVVMWAELPEHPYSGMEEFLEAPVESET